MHSFRANTPSNGWNAALACIERDGVNVVTEDRQMTREVQNLVIEIKHPDQGWPIKGSGWGTMEALDDYANQFFIPQCKGFTYTYGERLNHHSQISKAIAHLQQDPTTRRAIAKTWQPCKDYDMQHVPCLQLVEFLNRDEALHMTAVFRSNDIKQAWPCNVYGLQTLLAYAADIVGVPMGTLTTHSISAHYYIV